MYIFFWSIRLIIDHKIKHEPLGLHYQLESYTRSFQNKYVYQNWHEKKNWFIDMDHEKENVQQ